MNQYLLYGIIFVCALVLALLIPGVKVLAELLLKGIVALFTEILKHKWTFFIWFIKTLSADHGRVITHALKPRDELDPTQKIRRKAAGYEN